MILAGIAIISILLAIACQYYCEAPMAELNTKLNNTEKKMQAAYECENMHACNHYGYCSSP